MQDLHLLIQSLSPTEKRYVTIYLNKFSSTKNNYSILFQSIEKQGVYDEAELIKKLRKESFIKHLSVTKHYLFELILDAMCEYFGDHFLDWKLKKQVAQILVLTSKGLDKAAHKLIIRTKKEAWQYENYFVLVDILNHEKWLFGNRRIELQNTNYGIEKCYEEQQVYSELKLLQDFKTIWHQLTQIELNQNKYSIEEYHQLLQQCMQNQIVKNKSDIKAFVIQTWFHSVWAHYYMLIDDKINHFNQYEEVIKIRELQITEQPLSPIDLIATYYNFILACYQNQQWETLEIYLSKLIYLDAKSIEKKVKKFHDYYHGKLLLCLGTEKYNDGYLLLDEIKSGLITYNDKIRLDFLIWIYQCCGLICFFNKKHKEANFWWLKIINLDKSLIEIKTQCKVELYYILHTILLNEFEVLDYQIQQAEKKLKDYQFLGNSEKIFLQFATRVYKETCCKTKDLQQLHQEISIEIQKHSTFLIDEHVLKMIKFNEI